MGETHEKTGTMKPELLKLYKASPRVVKAGTAWLIKQGFLFWCVAFLRFVTVYQTTGSRRKRQQVPMRVCSMDKYEKEKMAIKNLDEETPTGQGEEYRLYQRECSLL
jgi:hypothetical protein